MNIDEAFTILLSFHLTAVIIEETSVTIQHPMFFDSLLPSYLNPAMVDFQFGLPLLFQRRQQFASKSNVAVTQDL